MLRWYRPDLVHEVTLRTIDGRWWFDAHNPSMRSEIIGALAMAQRETAVHVHAFTLMSNHYHGLFSFDYSEQFSAFLCHFHAGLARIANRYWHRHGRVWDGRAAVIPVASDEESQLQRLDYLLAQNVKAGAGAHPRDWIGASSTAWLLDGTALTGTHRDQTAITLASRNGRDPGDLAKYCQDVEVEMTPLPCFAGRPDHEWRAQVLQIADEISQRYGAAPDEPPSQVALCTAGSALVSTGRFAEIPSELPETTECVRTSPEPRAGAIKPVHAARKLDREALLAERKAFEQEYREAAWQLRNEAAVLAAGQPGRLVAFPLWSFPPRAPSCPRWPAPTHKSCNSAE
jgi:REP element-mobilizing transposase RayT